MDTDLIAKTLVIGASAVVWDDGLRSPSVLVVNLILFSGTRTAICPNAHRYNWINNQRSLFVSRTRFGNRRRRTIN